MKLPALFFIACICPLVIRCEILLNDIVFQVTDSPFKYSYPHWETQMVQLYLPKHLLNTDGSTRTLETVLADYTQKSELGDVADAWMRQENARARTLQLVPCLALLNDLAHTQQDQVSMVALCENSIETIIANNDPASQQPKHYTRKLTFGFLLLSLHHILGTAQTGPSSPAIENLSFIVLEQLVEFEKNPGRYLLQNYLNFAKEGLFYPFPLEEIEFSPEQPVFQYLPGLYSPRRSTVVFPVPLVRAAFDPFYASYSAANGVVQRVAQWNALFRSYAGSRPHQDLVRQLVPCMHSVNAMLRATRPSPRLRLGDLCFGNVHRLSRAYKAKIPDVYVLISVLILESIARGNSARDEATVFVKGEIAVFLEKSYAEFNKNPKRFVVGNPKLFIEKGIFYPNFYKVKDIAFEDKPVGLRIDEEHRKKGHLLLRVSKIRALRGGDVGLHAMFETAVSMRSDAFSKNANRLFLEHANTLVVPATVDALVTCTKRLLSKLNAPKLKRLLLSAECKDYWKAWRGRLEEAAQSGHDVVHAQVLRNLAWAAPLDWLGYVNAGTHLNMIPTRYFLLLQQSEVTDIVVDAKLHDPLTFKKDPADPHRHQLYLSPRMLLDPTPAFPAGVDWTFFTGRTYTKVLAQHSAQLHKSVHTMVTQLAPAFFRLYAAVRLAPTREQPFRLSDFGLDPQKVRATFHKELQKVLGKRRELVLARTLAWTLLIEWSLWLNGNQRPIFLPQSLMALLKAPKPPLVFSPINEIITKLVFSKTQRSMEYHRDFDIGARAILYIPIKLLTDAKRHKEIVQGYEQVVGYAPLTHVERITELLTHHEGAARASLHTLLTFLVPCREWLGSTWAAFVASRQTEWDIEHVCPGYQDAVESFNRALADAPLAPLSRREMVHLSWVIVFHWLQELTSKERGGLKYVWIPSTIISMIHDIEVQAS